VAAESAKDEPAPAPSATVPPDRATSETDPAATDPGRKGD
jgi:NADH-quinone oxidoreductase subunit E